LRCDGWRARLAEARRARCVCVCVLAGLLLVALAPVADATRACIDVPSLGGGSLRVRRQLTCCAVGGSLTRFSRVCHSHRRDGASAITRVCSPPSAIPARSGPES
jgi:hypothetical protein